MKKMKGSFIGIFILMFIISVTVTSILSVYLSGYERYDIACKAENAPDIINIVFEKDYDEVYEEKLKLQEEVKAVENIKEKSASIKNIIKILRLKNWAVAF